MGDKEVTCQSNGEWSTVPECKLCVAGKFANEENHLCGMLPKVVIQTFGAWACSAEIFRSFIEPTLALKTMLLSTMRGFIRQT